MDAATLERFAALVRADAFEPLDEPLALHRRARSTAAPTSTPCSPSSTSWPARFEPTLDGARAPHLFGSGLLPRQRRRLLRPAQLVPRTRCSTAGSASRSRWRSWRSRSAGASACRSSGIGMPGHFLVRDKVDPSVFVDPFHGGRVLDADGCSSLPGGASPAARRRWDAGYAAADRPPRRSSPGCSTNLQATLDAARRRGPAADPGAAARRDARARRRASELVAAGSPAGTERPSSTSAPRRRTRPMDGLRRSSRRGQYAVYRFRESQGVASTMTITEPARHRRRAAGQRPRRRAARRVPAEEHRRRRRSSARSSTSAWPGCTSPRATAASASARSCRSTINERVFAAGGAEPVLPQPDRLRHVRPDGRRVGQRGAEAALPAPAVHRRGDLVPAVPRARLRAPTSPACRRAASGRRRVDRQRPEGVDHARPPRPLGPARRAHRPRGREARRAHRLRRRHARTRRRGPPAAPDDRRGRVQRGVLHRRPHPRHRAARQAGRRLAGVADHADERAGVDRRRHPAARARADRRSWSRRGRTCPTDRKDPADARRGDEAVDPRPRCCA